MVVSTGTASGKSLCLPHPGADRSPRGHGAHDGRGAPTTLYLSPTKALAADQLRALAALGLADVRAAAFDGDTPTGVAGLGRASTRRTSSPTRTCCTARLLPGHARWARFLRDLRYVVVDECHTYRGVFGSHVAAVLRRLRRVCAHYGSDPDVRARLGHRLRAGGVGRPAGRAARWMPVTADGSPRGGRCFALWEPPLTELAGEQRGAGTAVGDRPRSADLLDRPGRRRRADASPSSGRGAAAEIGAADRPAAARRGRPRRWRGRVAAYRGGLPAGGAAAAGAACSRASCSASPPPTRWSSAWTSPAWTRWCSPASPGTRASLWQQAGRAGRGRAGRRWRCWWPATTRSTPISPTTPRRCSAGRSRRPCSTRRTPTSWPRTCAPRPPELPLTDDDLALFGPTPRPRWPTTWSTAACCGAGPPGWFWTRPDRATDLADIRGTGGRAGAARRGGDRAPAGHRRRRRRARQRARGGGVRAPGRDVPRVARSTSTSSVAMLRAGRAGLTDRAPATSPTSRSSTTESTRAWGHGRAVLRDGRR